MVNFKKISKLSLIIGLCLTISNNNLQAADAPDYAEASYSDSSSMSDSSSDSTSQSSGSIWDTVSDLGRAAIDHFGREDFTPAPEHVSSPEPTAPSSDK